MAGIGRLRSIVIDCSDTRVLAEFYRDLLGWEIIHAAYEDEDGWAVVSDVTTRLAFQRVADYHRPRWPDPAHPQQFHIDLAVDDLDEAEQQALKLGARKAEVQLSPGDADPYRTFLDPAGHPFCLCVIAGRYG